MERTGTKFIRPAVPNKIEKQEDGRLKVGLLFYFYFLVYLL